MEKGGGGEERYLWVILNPLHCLLLGLASTGTELSLQTFLRLLLNLSRERSVVVLLGFRADVQSPVVLLHGD